MNPLLTGTAFLVLGTLCGGVHFALLHRSVAAFVGGVHALSCAGWTAFRIALTGAMFVWAALDGAPALWSALGGFLAARAIVLHFARTL